MTAISAAQVEQYLLDNPDFLLTRDALLQKLQLAAPKGDAIPLIERQAALLKARNQELRERLQALVQTARDNDLLFEKTRNLILAMLEATSLDKMAMAMEKYLVDDFGVDFFSLFLFDAPANGRYYHGLSTASASLTLGTLATSPHAICGELRDKERSALFGDKADRVRSAAAQPFQYGEFKGVIALGSRDPERYRSSMGTLFLGYVGDVAARTMAHLDTD